MILCSFSPCPDDALLASGATYQKKNLSITLRRESLVWPIRTTWEIRDLGKPLHVLPLNDTTYLLLDSSRSVYGQSIGPRIYSSIREIAILVAPPRRRFSLFFRASHAVTSLRLWVWWMSGKIFIEVPVRSNLSIYIYNIYILYKIRQVFSEKTCSCCSPNPARD